MTESGIWGLLSGLCEKGGLGHSPTRELSTLQKPQVTGKLTVEEAGVWAEPWMPYSLMRLEARIGNMQ